MSNEKQSDRIESLEKSQEELQGAVRRLSSEISSNLALVSKVREDFDMLRQEFVRLKNAVEATKVQHDNGVTRYE